MICKSICHWAHNYPECRLSETSTQNKAENITLFTESVQSCYMENFLGETLSNAILDTGCTQTVCGESWLQCYIDTLCESDRNSIETISSETKFRSGDGQVHTSLRKVNIPAEISGVKVHMTDVIDCDLPLVLSRSAMQKAETKYTFKEIKLQCLERNKIYILQPVAIIVFHVITTVRLTVTYLSLIKRELSCSLII